MLTSRKSVFASGCVLAAALASIPFWPRALSFVDPDANLVFAEPTFDFGEVTEGAQIVHRFALQNTGSLDLRLDPIVVNAVKASCSLPNALTVSVPSFSDTDTVVLPPGAATHVVTTLDTEGYALTAFDGNFSQRIRIYSNDPETPRSILHLKGRIQPIIFREPVEVQLGALFKDNGALPTHIPPVRLMPAAGIVMNVISVESNVPFLTPSVAPAPNGDGYLVTAAIDPDVPEGHFGDAHITVYTDHPKKPTVVIPVSAQVYAARPVLAAPEFIDFGLVKPGEQLSGRVVLERLGDANWKVVSIKTTVEGSPAEASVKRVGSRYDLTVAATAPSRAWAGFSGQVEVTTDTRSRQTLVVPFAGWTYDDSAFSLPNDRLHDFVSGVLGHERFTTPQDVITKVLGGGTHPRTVPLLDGIVRGSGTLRGRLQAVALMEQFPGPATLEALETFIRSDADDLVRDDALAVYFAMAPDQSLPLLVQALKDPSEWVRLTAATLLGELGDARAKPFLLEASRDPKPDVALAAVEALEQFFSDGEPQD